MPAPAPRQFALAAAAAAAAASARPAAAQTTTVYMTHMAVLEPYPGYVGPPTITGTTYPWVSDTGVGIFSEDIAGLPVGTSGGIHVHEGFTCDTAGGHYVPYQPDVWVPTYNATYTVPDAAYAITKAIAGPIEMSEVAKRVVVVHLPSGTRAACGKIVPVPGGPAYKCTEYENEYISCAADIISDPHFTGLDGRSYDVTGISGSVYSILSDAGLAVNARFSTAYTTGLDAATGLPYHAKGTWITAIGVVTPEGTLEVHANGTMTASPGLAVSGEWPRVSVSTESMDMEMTAVPPPAAWGVPDDEAAALTHINLRFGRLVASPYLHGLLGVTSRPAKAAVADVGSPATGKDGEGVIEGEVADYTVDGLTATGFKYSAFAADL